MTGEDRSYRKQTPATGLVPEPESCVPNPMYREFLLASNESREQWQNFLRFRSQKGHRNEGHEKATKDFASKAHSDIFVFHEKKR